MCVTEFGSLKLSKELQVSKAESQMWVTATESEMVKVTNEL